MTLHPQLLQLAPLFDCIDDVLAWVKDRAGRYRWVNHAFLLNYAFNERRDTSDPDIDEVLGKTDYELSPAFLADLFRMDDEYVMTGKRIVNRIELVGQPDGKPVWNVTNKIPLVGEGGTIIGTAGITRTLDAAGQGVASGSEFGAVLAFMRDHYHVPIPNRRLARISHMSVRAFERKFHLNFHLTPQKYLRRLRLRMASRALVYTAKPLAQVASECGFSDQSHFTRLFHSHFGRTPRAYREYYAREEAGAALVLNLAGAEQEPAVR